MSTWVYMMRADVDADLALRLEQLTGQDIACCLDDLQQDAAAVQATPGLSAALLRAKALADEKRMLAALLLKRRGSLCACEVQAALGITHATVSHHMGSLQKAGLVVSERRGKWVHYRLAPGADTHLP